VRKINGTAQALRMTPPPGHERERLQQHGNGVGAEWDETNLSCKKIK